jgi:hypothetical protein
MPSRKSVRYAPGSEVVGRAGRKEEAVVDSGISRGRELEARPMFAKVKRAGAAETGIKKESAREAMENSTGRGRRVSLMVRKEEVVIKSVDVEVFESCPALLRICGWLRN